MQYRSSFFPVHSFVNVCHVVSHGCLAEVKGVVQLALRDVLQIFLVVLGFDFLDDFSALALDVSVVCEALVLEGKFVGSYDMIMIKLLLGLTRQMLTQARRSFNSLSFVLVLG